ncbi:MAG TPA: ferritin-like domain-containing protein, partial [Rhodothermales bacterium]|nr:ferritin-like domain-containing protein [Rhodothermales bacterium]
MPLRPSARWAAYFARNAGAPRGIPWERGVRWSPAERRAVAASVQEFQLGEQSEGNHLRRCAAHHAAATGDARYTDAVALFIAEEKRHAAELARLLGLAGVPLRTATPVDTVFRGLRKLRLRAEGGLENCIRVTVTAEVVATTYYDALTRATACPVTRALCRRILRDEAAHVRFHAERLARLGEGRGHAARATAHAAHRALAAVTCGVVWLGPHRRVYQRGGYT